MKTERYTAFGFARLGLIWAGGITMENMHSTGHLLRKVAMMTLIGFLVITLAGPIFALLGVILPFALVGFLVWAVVRGIMLGPVVVGRIIGNTARAVGRTAVALPLWFARRVRSGIGLLGRLVMSAAGVIFPVAAGAAVGAILGMLGGEQYHDADMRVPAGALIGAGIGLIAAFWGSRPAASVARPAHETLERAV